MSAFVELLPIAVSFDAFTNIGFWAGVGILAMSVAEAAGGQGGAMGLDLQYRSGGRGSTGHGQTHDQDGGRDPCMIHAAKPPWREAARGRRGTLEHRPK
jgi:hypothetical protein